MNSFFIKTNRIFSPLRKWSWLFLLIVAFGGLWFPKLGLLMIPIMIALPIIGFSKGKYWCGNICPHGSLFDQYIMPLSSNRKIPAWAKSRVTMSLGFAWFMYMLSIRLIKVAVLWGTISFWDRLGFIFVMNYFVVTVVGTTLAFFINPRTWCNFCPMGTVQKLFYKLGKFLGLSKYFDEKVTIASKEMCHSCGKCSRVCPMQLTPYTEFNDINQFASEACIRCSTCVVNCPAGILSLDKEETAIRIKEEVILDGYEHIQMVPSVINQIRDLGNEVKEYTFKIKGHKLEYIPGQFILVKILDTPITYRAYSISGYDKETNELRVTIKKAPNGYGTGIIFNTFKKGDKVELKGPMGNELIVDKQAKKVIFVAGGIGITPFVPMAESMVTALKCEKEVHLVYGVNKADEFLYEDSFDSLEDKCSKFAVNKVVAFDPSWKGKKGFVTDVLKEIDVTDSKVYICGPKPMITPTIRTLKDLGVKEEDIYYESA